MIEEEKDSFGLIGTSSSSSTTSSCITNHQQTTPVGTIRIHSFLEKIKKEVK